jgi:two-component system chemotaxis response regulator CheY
MSESSYLQATDPTLPILLIDDNKAMRQTVRSMLLHLGFVNVTQDDGLNASIVIQDRPFGLIISDLMMVPLNGLSLLKELRANRERADTPFIMITGVADVAFVVAAKKLRVDDYLVKPFNTATLGRKVFATLAKSKPIKPAKEETADQEKLQKLETQIAALFEVLHGRIKTGELGASDDIVNLVRAYIDEAVTLGIEEDYRDQLEVMLASVQKSLLTQTPNLNAVLLSPQPKAIQPDDARTAVAASKQPHSGLSAAIVAPDRRQIDEPPLAENRSGREARRYKRFVSPALQVSIGDRTYRTGDWSIFGLRVLGFGSALTLQKPVKVGLRIEGIDDPNAVFNDQGTVVRCGAGELGIEFTTRDSAVLKILEFLTHHRLKPIELGDTANRPATAGPRA